MQLAAKLRQDVSLTSTELPESLTSTVLATTATRAAETTQAATFFGMSLPSLPWRTQKESQYVTRTILFRSFAPNCRDTSQIYSSLQQVRSASQTTHNHTPRYTKAIAISDVFWFNFQPYCPSYDLPHKHEIQKYPNQHCGLGTRASDS